MENYLNKLNLTMKQAEPYEKVTNYNLNNKQD